MPSWHERVRGLACGLLALGQVAGRLTQAPCVSSSGRYAVFGLGSSMYPQFCAFAHDIDQKLSQLGASQLAPTGEGDELSGQEEAFRSWAVQTFKVGSQLGAAPPHGQGGCGALAPQTPVPGILAVTAPLGPIGMVPVWAGSQVGGLRSLLHPNSPQKSSTEICVLQVGEGG